MARVVRTGEGVRIELAHLAAIDALAAVTVALPDGRTLIAYGGTDGGITVEPLPSAG